MRNYLLDVNVLVAWGWTDHVAHERVARWIGACRQGSGTMLLTSSIPQLGFIRVSMQRTAGRVTVEQAAKVLRGMLSSLELCHRFIADDHVPSNELNLCGCSAAQTTDVHLLGLASAHDACLATLDTGISDAFLLPQFPSEN